MSNVNDVLTQRNSQYGDFVDDARLAQQLKDTMYYHCSADGREGWDDLEHDQAQALEMIATKMARIINGNPNNIDSWFDIAGYAQLIVNRLKKESEAIDVVSVP